MNRAVLVLAFLFHLVHGHPFILDDYHSRKIVVEVLDKHYENYLSIPADSALRNVARDEFLTYYDTFYMFTFTWLHQVVAAKGSLPEENLLEVAVETMKGNRLGFLSFLDEVKSFAKRGFNAELRYLTLSGQSQELIKSLKAIYTTYLSDIDDAVDVALAHFDFNSLRFKTEVEQFVKTGNLKWKNAHQVIHDFLQKKYTFRSWMVALYDAHNTHNIGCHRQIEVVDVAVSGNIHAAIYNVPHDSFANEEEAKKLEETGKRVFSDAHCTDKTKNLFPLLNIDCPSVKWTKAIILFYNDFDVFRVTATNMKQMNYWPLRASFCSRHEYALVTFG